MAKSSALSNGCEFLAFHPKKHFFTSIPGRPEDDALVLEGDQTWDNLDEIGAEVAKDRTSTCGRGRSVGDRIVGGHLAPLESFPWAASIQLSYGYHFCGASLIQPQVPFLFFFNFHFFKLCLSSVGDHCSALCCLGKRSNAISDPTWRSKPCFLFLFLLIQAFLIYLTRSQPAC